MKKKFDFTLTQYRALIKTAYKRGNYQGAKNAYGFYLKAGGKLTYKKITGSD